MTDPIFINNAGLIILAPFLGSLFEKLELMDGSVFKSKASKSKAVHVLNYLATGKNSQEEHELNLNKILCGLNIYAPLDEVTELEEAEKEIANSLLLAVIGHWSVLKETSIQGLRESFLKRNGKLIEEDGQFLLSVEQKSFDMLLDQIPWNISKIKLSWMQKMIEVEWR